MASFPSAKLGSSRGWSCNSDVCQTCKFHEQDRTAWGVVAPCTHGARTVHGNPLGFAKHDSCPNTRTEKWRTEGTEMERQAGSTTGALTKNGLPMHSWRPAAKRLHTQT